MLFTVNLTTLTFWHTIINDCVIVWSIVKYSVSWMSDQVSIVIPEMQYRSALVETQNTIFEFFSDMSAAAWPNMIDCLNQLEEPKNYTVGVLQVDNCDEVEFYFRKKCWKSNAICHHRNSVLQLHLYIYFSNVIWYLWKDKSYD